MELSLEGLRSNAIAELNKIQRLIEDPTKNSEDLKECFEELHLPAITIAINTMRDIIVAFCQEKVNAHQIKDFLFSTADVHKLNFIGDLIVFDKEVTNDR
jgi:F0F1-type ATP synthase delta subunit